LSYPPEAPDERRRRTGEFSDQRTAQKTVIEVIEAAGLGSISIAFA
jgi:hypothetical protein